MSQVSAIESEVIEAFFKEIKERQLVSEKIADAIKLVLTADALNSTALTEACFSDEEVADAKD